MDLNNKNLEVLSAELKMDKEALINAIITPDAPELKLPERVIYAKSDYDILLGNIRNEEYHKGKTAGDEMSLKEIKKFASEKYGINTEGIKSHKEVIELIDKKKSDEYKTLFEGEKDSKVKELLTKNETLTKEIDLFRQKFVETEENYKTQLANKDNEVKRSVIDRELTQVNIPYDIPKNLVSQEERAKYVQTENIKFFTILKSMYDFDILDNSIILKNKNGDILKDKLMQPVKYNSDFALDFAKQMNFNLSTNGGIQRPDGTKITNNFTGASKEQFDAVMKENGIITGSTQYLTYYSEWKKSNS
jgi:hypothetical protein